MTETLRVQARRLGSVLFVAAVMLLPADAATAAVEFTPTALTIPPGQAHDIAVGDLDGKNGPDIVAALNTDGLSVSLNAGNGTFAPPVTYPTGCPVYDVELGDLGGGGGVTDHVLDGHLDAAFLCVLNSGDTQYLGRAAGDGAGGFGTANRVPALSQGAFAIAGPQAIALVPLRAAGLPPVPFYTYGTGSSGNYQRLLCATYDWQQSTCGGDANPGPLLFAATIADAKLFTLGGARGILDWGFEPNWHTSTRDLAPAPATTAGAFHSITTGDLHGDGPDLMSSAGTCGCGYQDNPAAGVVTVNYGTDAAGVPDQVGTTIPSAPGVINISTGDFDLDGHEDVIGSTYTYDAPAGRVDNGFFVQAGDGAGGLGPPQTFTLAHVDGGFRRAPVRVADLDANGGPDAVAIIGGQVQVLLNAKSGSPTPPGGNPPFPPGGLPPGGNPLSGIKDLTKKAKLDSKGSLILGSATNPPTASVLLTLSAKAPKGGSKKPVVIGKADVSIPAGEERSLKVQLNKKGRKLVGRRPLKASLKIVATAGDGSQATDDRKVKLIPKTKPK